MDFLKALGIGIVGFFIGRFTFKLYKRSKLSGLNSLNFGKKNIFKGLSGDQKENIYKTAQIDAIAICAGIKPEDLVKTMLDGEALKNHAKATGVELKKALKEREAELARQLEIKKIKERQDRLRS